MNENNNKTDLKKFLIKLAAITLAIIIVINVSFNLIFASKLEAINMILSFNKNGNNQIIKNKIRQEIRKGLDKDQMINDEDKILLLKFYKKIKKEFSNLENN